MKTLKKFALYILCIVLFYILSNFLIFVGLNNTYKTLKIQGDLPEGISINHAQATSVNGRILGSTNNTIDSSYIKFNFFNDQNQLSDSFYLKVSDIENGNFKFNFKLNYIKTYSVELTDEEPITTNTENFSFEEYKSTVLLAALAMLLFI